jgi:hypothetical protein|tara:strand:+ start:2700 stop:3080 length:381 start_codon:yes stop_codon:yes gene_type:complete
MYNFDLAQFLREGGIEKKAQLLKEDQAPGFDTRKQGEPLPTAESVKAAYEAKNDIKEEEYWPEDSSTEDYDTEGYVEAMGPELDTHIDEILKIFTEWKSGPMTEPGMEGYAKDDLVNYIQRKIRNA